MRVWLEDRPGALGMLTSALGVLGADVLGIDILERDGARVVDEITVCLPEHATQQVLVAAVARLEGVQVEDVRDVVDRLPYPGSDPLDIAVELSVQHSPAGVLSSLANGVAAVFSGDWAAVLRPREETVLVASAGAPPRAGWLSAFISGASSRPLGAANELRGPSDIAWAVLERSEASVVVGRGGPPFRGQERRRLVQLAAIADQRWLELTIRSSMIAHPSATISQRTHPAVSVS